MTTFFMRIAPAILLGLSLALVGCGSSKKQSASGGDGPADDPGEGMQLEVNGDSDSGRAGALQTVFFDYDSSQLTSDARSTLEGNAQYLQSNPGLQIQIEGHCDERGGVEHNLALGEKRARAIKNYLQSMGITSQRLNTVSYGKERPLVFGHDEAAWGRNRRANFVVLAK